MPNASCQSEVSTLFGSTGVAGGELYLSTNSMFLCKDSLRPSLGARSCWLASLLWCLSCDVSAPAAGVAGAGLQSNVVARLRASCLAPRARQWHERRAQIELAAYKHTSKTSKKAIKAARGALTTHLDQLPIFSIAAVVLYNAARCAHSRSTRTSGKQSSASKQHQKTLSADDDR